SPHCEVTGVERAARESRGVRTQRGIEALQTAQRRSLAGRPGPPMAPTAPRRNRRTPTRNPGTQARTRAPPVRTGHTKDEAETTSTPAISPREGFRTKRETAAAKPQETGRGARKAPQHLTTSAPLQTRPKGP